MKQIKSAVKKNENGFTLLELLVVLGILSILFMVVFVALDPLKQFAESRNVRRWNDVNNISTALYRYIINSGSFPPGLSSEEKQLGTSQEGCNNVCSGAQTACLDLSSELKPYLAEMPIDPKGGSIGKTYYSVTKNSDNVVVVKACNAENLARIQLSR